MSSWWIILCVNNSTLAACLTNRDHLTHDVDEAIFLADRVAVLGARPTSLKEIIDVDLPRPRDQFATREDPRFLKLRHDITASLLARSNGHVASV